MRRCTRVILVIRFVNILAANYTDRDLDEASLEKNLVTEPPGDMCEYQRNSNLIHMHYAYKSSIKEELLQNGNDSSDYDSDEVDPYNYLSARRRQRCSDRRF